MIDKDVACAESHVKSKSSYTAMYSKSNSRGVMTLSAALCVAMTATCATLGAGAREVVETRNTSLVLERDDVGAWVLSYYGARLSNANDAGAMAWSSYCGTSDLGTRKPVSYACFGSRNVKGYVNAFDKFGGLCVTHADGCVTTDLFGEGVDTIDEGNDVTHLVLKLKDRPYPFYVRQHFRAHKASDVIETWVELENREAGAVRLVRMDSAAFLFPLMAHDLRVQSAAANWSSEGQITETSLGRGQTISLSGHGGVHGAWGSNPSFMLSVGGKATERTGTVFGGALCWSGMWDIAIGRDEIDTVTVCAGASTAAGGYVLDPGKAIDLPHFAFTWSERGKGQVSRNFHRWARECRLRNGKALRPVLLNSWEGSYFSFTEKTLHDMMDGVREMGGELFVLDDGWFGKGKYARDDRNRERAGLGDWVEDENHIPNGLSGLAAEARKRGLKFGFWIEPEMANTNSWLYTDHPDWIIREKNRSVAVGRGRSQVVLDFANPAVREHVFNQIDALCAKLPDLAYIKWDANADFMNYGSTYLDAAHQANLAFDYTKGVYDFLARLRAKYPQVAIQACASGGGRMEYGILGHCDEFWASDNTDARERVFIQWGASMFYPACATAAHVTKVPKKATRRSTPLKYRFDVAMTGRMGFELHPHDFSAEELVFAKKCVATYKELRPTIQQGDLYRLASPYENDYAALMYVNENLTEAVVFVLGLERGSRREYIPSLRLDGLDAQSRYRVEEVNMAGETHSLMNGKTIGGDALTSGGLRFVLRGDHDSAVFVLRAQ